MKKYQTEQKKRLIAFLAENENRQFSAEELSVLLEKEGDDAGKTPGKSTVYRLVSELTEEGMLRRFPRSEGSGWTYQYHRVSDCMGHLHLKCEKCGTLLHLECGMSKELLAHIESEHGFLVDNQKTVLFGLCAACRSAESKTKAACRCRH